MDVLSLLHNRVSQTKLTFPAPQGEALENILKAALTAPDHGAFTPWEFIVCEGEGLNRVSKIYQDAAINADKTDAEVTKMTNMPFRAPMMIVAIARCKPHPKVPIIEQVESAACALYAMQLAADAQGFGSIWRTGELALNPDVKAAFELGEHDEIVGFLYVGTPETDARVRTPKSIDDYCKRWS